jgi:hypothetical protein
MLRSRRSFKDLWQICRRLLVEAVQSLYHFSIVAINKNGQNSFVSDYSWFLSGILRQTKRDRDFSRNLCEQKQAKSFARYFTVTIKFLPFAFLFSEGCNNKSFLVQLPCRAIPRINSCCFQTKLHHLNSRRT